MPLREIYMYQDFGEVVSVLVPLIPILCEAAHYFDQPPREFGEEP